MGAHEDITGILRYLPEQQLGARLNGAGGADVSYADALEMLQQVAAITALQLDCSLLAYQVSGAQVASYLLLNILRTLLEQ